MTLPTDPLSECDPPPTVHSSRPTHPPFCVSSTMLFSFAVILQSPDWSKTLARRCEDLVHRPSLKNKTFIPLCTFLRCSSTATAARQLQESLCDLSRSLDRRIHLLYCSSSGETLTPHSFLRVPSIFGIPIALKVHRYFYSDPAKVESVLCYDAPRTRFTALRRCE